MRRRGVGPSRRRSGVHDPTWLRASTPSGNAANCRTIPVDDLSHPEKEDCASSPSFKGALTPDFFAFLRKSRRYLALPCAIASRLRT